MSKVNFRRMASGMVVSVLEDVDSLEKMTELIAITQDNEWDGRCNRAECYWNMNSPIKNPDDFQCVSESLCDTKMVPDTTDCPSYWDYEVACGCKKGE